jgi:hypothetical protein
MMKLYRIIGQREYFSNTGMLPIDHIVSSNLTEIKKECTKLRTTWRKAGLSHKVRIESLETFKITSKLLGRTLSTENTEHLIKSRTTLKEWTYEHCPESIEQSESLSRGQEAPMLQRNREIAVPDKRTSRKRGRPRKRKS